MLLEPQVRLSLAAASSAHWQRLLADDREAADVASLMQLACSVRAAPEESRPLPLPHSPRGAGRALVEGLQAARPHARSRCFAQGERRQQGAPAVLVALHGSSGGEAASLWLHQVWAAFQEIPPRFEMAREAPSPPGVGGHLPPLRAPVRPRRERPARAAQLGRAD